MSKRITGRYVTDRTQARTTGRLAALEQFPPAVYAARLADGTIKVGWSNSMHRRLEKFGAGVELLALRPGTRADELAIHRSLREHLAHGREFYHPTADVLAVVNGMRAEIGLASV